MRKFFKFFAIFLGLLVVAGGLFIAFFDFGKLINEQKDKYVPELEKMLGRKVQIGEVKTTILPVLGAEVRDIVILGRTPEEDPLMKLDKVVFQVELLTLIKSLGNDMQLRSLVFDGLTVNLIREKDGSLSYEDVLKRLSEGPPPEEAPKPLDPEVRKRIETLQLKRIALERGRFRLVDKMVEGPPAETYINDLLVELDDVVLSSPFELHVAAAVFAEKQNFDFRTRLGPIPIGQENAPPPPVEWVKIKADDINLAGISPYLPGDAPAKLGTARFSANLEIDDPMAKSGRIKAAGDVAVAQLQLGHPQPGKPFDLKLSPNVLYDPKAGELDVTGFSLALDDMVLTANGKVLAPPGGVPSFQDLKVKTEKFNLGRLFAMFPDAAKGLPPGAVLDGGFAINIDASGNPDAQQIKADLNFDGARIMMPGSLDKPSGTPLNTQIDADLSRTDLNLKSLKVTVGDLVLALAGTVKNFANPAINIKGGTGKFDINGPVRLLPNVKQSIPPDVKVAGQAEIDLNVKGGKDNIDAQVIVGIYGADLAVPGTTVRGTGKVEVNAKGNPAGNMTVLVDAGLSGLDIDTGALSKGPGVPFDVKVNVAKAGQVVTLGQLLLNFGPLKMSGSGTANLGSGVLDVKVGLDRFSLADLGKMLPAIKETPVANATLGMKLAFSGDPNKATTVKAAMEDFFFGMGASSLAGKVTVENLEAPKIRFDFTSPNLDLDQMFPPAKGGGKAAPAGGGGGGGGGKSEPPPPIVKKIDAAGQLSIAKGRAGGFPFTKFIASLTLKDGILKFSKLDFDSYEGHFSAAQTSVDIGSAVPSFDTKFTMKNVNANTLLAQQANLPGTLSGRLSTEIAVKGKGAEWKELSKNLSGTLGAALANGQFHKADIQKSVMDPLQKKVPFIKLPGGPAGTALKDLAGKFIIKDGKATLKEPMKANTPQGPLVMDGYIGLDKTLNLKSKLMLEPKTVQALTQNKVKPTKPMPVGLTIGGKVDNPAITGVEVKELAELLIKEYAKQLGAEKLLEAQKKAEELAKKKLAEVQKKADEVKNKAKAEAEKQKNKAKNKAKDKVKGLIKGF